MAKTTSTRRGSIGRGSRGSCGGTPKRNGSGGGVGNRNKSPKRKK